MLNYKKFLFFLIYILLVPSVAGGNVEEAVSAVCVGYNSSVYEDKDELYLKKMYAGLIGHEKDDQVISLLCALWERNESIQVAEQIAVSIGRSSDVNGVRDLVRLILDDGWVSRDLVLLYAAILYKSDEYEGVLDFLDKYSDLFNVPEGVVNVENLTRVRLGSYHIVFMDFEHYSYRARSLMEMGRYEEAINVAAKGFQQSPGAEELFSILISALLKAGRPDKADLILREHCGYIMFRSLPECNS